MRLVGRNDASLLAALAVSLVVLFSEPISRVLDSAREVERSRGLSLLPALFILVVVLGVHQMRKHHEAEAQAAASAAEAQASRARAEELERLVGLGEALARSLDFESIKDAVLQHLPSIVGARAHWVLVRDDGRWEPLVGGHDNPTRVAREHAADRALMPGHTPAEADVPAYDSGDACFVLVAGGTPIGVLGVSTLLAPLSEAHRRSIGAAAALLAITLKNAQLFREVRETSMRDPLTGCFTRAHALEVIEVELRRARRTQQPLALVMFDLDHFKEVNDRFGHLCGDAVLAAIGHRMRAVLRGSDLKCRYGGEEFLVLLPETPLHGATRVAETLRKEIGEQPVVWNADGVQVTASFGIAPALPGEVNAAGLIARADAALYRAKDDGRNCVRLATETLFS